MKQSGYFKFHEDLCNEARALSQKKNNDYADPDNREGDPFAIFANFMQCEHLGICSVEQGMCVRLSDKFSRLCNILKPGHKQGVMDESIRDTALDIINYVALLLGYLETKRLQGFPEPPVETDEEKKAEAKRRAIANLTHELGVRLKKSKDGAFGNAVPPVDSTISESHKEMHLSEIMKAEADLYRDTWRWFLSRSPYKDLRANYSAFQRWLRAKEKNENRFVCPFCCSIYWGTHGFPGKRKRGSCHGFSHGQTMPDGKDCMFNWDRETEDKFVGLGEKP